MLIQDRPMVWRKCVSLWSCQPRMFWIYLCFCFSLERAVSTLRGHCEIKEMALKVFIEHGIVHSPYPGGSVPKISVYQALKERLPQYGEGTALVSIFMFLPLITWRKDDYQTDNYTKRDHSSLHTFSRRRRYMIFYICLFVHTRVEPKAFQMIV